MAVSIDRRLKDLEARLRTLAPAGLNARDRLAVSRYAKLTARGRAVPPLLLAQLRKLQGVEGLREEMALAELRAQNPDAAVFEIPNPQGGEGILYQVRMPAHPPGSGE